MNIIEKTYTLNGGLQTRAKTDMIILHHAVYNGDVEGIDRIHKNQGWTCIGYHFYVRKDGSIYRGRREDAVGAHAYGSNTTSIGICAEGNFETDVMSDAQKNAIKELVAYLKNKYGITTIKRHKDVNATACPGKNYPFDEIVNGTVEAVKENTKTIEEIVSEVIAGKWGNGTDRKARLTNAGYNYNEIQDKVNEKLLGKTNASKKTGKTIDELAKEVIKGLWGNGADRKNRLTSAGYDYNAVQNRVNQILM